MHLCTIIHYFSAFYAFSQASARGPTHGGGKGAASGASYLPKYPKAEKSPLSYDAERAAMAGTLVGTLNGTMTLKTRQQDKQDNNF